MLAIGLTFVTMQTNSPHKTEFKYEPQDPKHKTVVHKTADGKAYLMRLYDLILK